MGTKTITAVAEQAAYLALLCLHQAGWLSDRARVKVWEKSRRIGASWVEALYSVLEAAKKKNEGGQNTYYLSYNKDMTRQFIKDCFFWCKIIGVAVGELEEIVSDYDKDVTIFRIRFASGNEIEALPSEPRSLRSKQGRVIVDEAAFVDDLPELLKAAMALLMWGGQVVILSTHNGVENAFNELIADIRAEKLPYSLHRTDLDNALEGGLYKAICRKGGREWTQEAQDAWRAETIQEYGGGADEELFCIPARSGGVWLTGALIESCMSDESPVLEWSPAIAREWFDAWAFSISRDSGLAVSRDSGLAAIGVTAIRDMLRGRDFVDIPKTVAAMLIEAWCAECLAPRLAALNPQERHFMGGDFGRVADLTVFWQLAERLNLHAHTPFTLELRDTPFRVQEQFLFYLAGGMPRFSGMALDARGIGMQLAESARQEYGPGMVAQVMLTESWYREHMPPVKSSLEDRSATLPKSAAVKDDFRSIRVINGVPRIPDSRTGGKGLQRHGDAAIAYALARFALATLGEAEEWDVATAGERASVGLLQGFR